MSGKAYTMKELKGIVEYLTEHKAYGETKARKMWTVYASSGLTHRTWQSLKETFLKRILPDIQNPYFKLSLNEIRSFQSGVDYTSKTNNKLEFRTSTEDTSGNDQKINKQPGTSNKNKRDEDITGEDNKCSKVSSSRDSVDTVILNTEESYENAQDMAKDLENIDQYSSQDSVKAHMSLRDCIVYSEPLTPLLQEIVDDFQSDSEPQMVIDEGPFSRQEIINVASSTSETTEIQDNNTENPDKDEQLLIPGEQQKEEKHTEAADDSKKKSLRLKKTKNENVALRKQKRSLSEGARSTSRTSNGIVTNNENNKVSRTQNIENSHDLFETTVNGKPTQNPSPFDSLLPNNQEELQKKDNEVSPQLEITQDNKEENPNNIKERTTSSDDTKNLKRKINRKKKLLESDSDEQKNNLMIKAKEDSVNKTNKHINNKDSRACSENEEEKSIKKTQKIEKRVKEQNTDVNVDSQESDKSNNPCLNSVSLYAEQFLTKQMSDSDHSATSKHKKTGIKISKTGNTIDDTQKNQNKLSKTRNIKKGTVSSDEANKPKANNKDTNSQSDMDSATKFNMLDEHRDNAINTSNEHNSNKEINKSNNKQMGSIIMGDKSPKKQKTEIILNSQESNNSANPCLQSVSLFAEQIPRAEQSDDNSSVKSNSKNTDLESAKSTNTVNKIRDIPDICKSASPSKISNNSISGNINMKQSEIVVLKSHSDTESEEGIQIQNAKNSIRPQYTNRQVLNNLFGNNSGLSRKRARNNSFRNGSVNRHIQRSSSESGEWTSDSDGEYVSPPRSRNRHCRKFLKPHSSRILSLEQDGGLFVAYGKKVYPLIKDGKVLKNYLTYLPESDDDDKESYWKVKYVEECKRTAELTRVLKQINDGPANADAKKCDSPILQSKSSNFRTTNGLPPSPRKINEMNNNKVIEQNAIPGGSGNEIALQKPIQPKAEEKTVKIKFAKDNGELFLEGHWQNIHPILSEVLHVFQKEGSSKTSNDRPETPIEIKSEKSIPIITQPIDEETHKKIDEIENRIFQEIEEIDKAENKDQTTTENGTENVTERPKRGPPNRYSPSVMKKSKRLKSSIESAKSDSEFTVVTTKLEPIKDNANATPARRRKRIQSCINETHKKINEIENGVFQKIEEIDKAENKDQATTENGTENITERPKRGPPNRYSPSVMKKSKRLKSSIESAKSDSEFTVVTTKLEPIKDNANATPARRRKRIQSCINDPVEESKSNSKELKTKNNAKNDDNESQVLYKFPSPEPERKRKPGRPKSYSKTNKVPRSNHDKTPKIYSSFDSVLLQSESSQGYHDSDYSPVYNLRKKRMSSLPSYSCRSKSKWSQSRRPSKYFYWDASDESSNSPFKIKSKSISMQNLTLNSEAYRSESYQLLMPHARSFHPMTRITEVSPCPNEMNSACDLMLSPASQVLEDRSNGSESLSVNTNVEAGNSSNVSLPLSPELSIVENISINKNMLPTINVIQAENESITVDYDEQYLISKVDVSVPLMSQDCNVETKMYDDCNSLSGSTKVSEVIKNATVSESLLDKMEVVNLEENPTISDSLDMRLENMLLDSAKKMTAQNTKTVASLINPNSVMNAKDNKKRCSTPRKRKSKKLKLPPVDSTIEECMEFCVSGRKSCPPMITTFYEEEQIEPIENHTHLDAASNVTKRRARKPKDIIKVKITKPKEKRKSVKAASKKSSKDISKASILTDSGINDTVSSVVLHDFNGGVDLIHNHSDTCLQTNECLSNSVELIDKSNSIISLNSSSLQFFENKENVVVREETRTSITPNMFCTDALDGISVSTDEVINLCNWPTNSGGASSLITEDLSDDITVQPRSQWHLLSEADTTNTLDDDTMKPAKCTMKSNYGSDLRKIFTDVCTVPDLSTITEMSRETESNSRKSFLQNTNSNTRNDFLKEFNDGTL